MQEKIKIGKTQLDTSVYKDDFNSDENNFYREVENSISTAILNFNTEDKDIKSISTQMELIEFYRRNTNKTAINYENKINLNFVARP